MVVGMSHKMWHGHGEALLSQASSCSCCCCIVLGCRGLSLRRVTSHWRPASTTWCVASAVRMAALAATQITLFFQLPYLSFRACVCARLCVYMFVCVCALIWWMCLQEDLKVLGHRNGWCPYFLARYTVGYTKEGAEKEQLKIGLLSDERGEKRAKDKLWVGLLGDGPKMANSTVCRRKMSFA